TGSFADKNVGQGKTVTCSMTLTGADMNNYSVPSGNLTADITKKALTISGLTVITKVYDGNTTAGFSGGTVTGQFTGDLVNISLPIVGNFADKNVGQNKTVNYTITLEGTDGGNYSANIPNLTGEITSKNLTVNGIVAANKEYDGNTTASITGGTLSGEVTGDVVLIATPITGAFVDKNVGQGKIVTYGVTLSGADMNNYSVTTLPQVLADITKKALTVSGLVAANKEYDGNTDASITGGTLSGEVTGDVVVLTTPFTGSFADENVGQSKVVTYSLTLTGVDAQNYSVPAGNLTADITKKALTISGLTVITKVYDGNTTAGF
ncbi:MAG: hypothetical protein GY787_10615, partial [Alteromonadales bacterium]|nr:hypothetical protein [Alteromonadales bacterium]